MFQTTNQKSSSYWGIPHVELEPPPEKSPVQIHSHGHCAHGSSCVDFIDWSTPGKGRFGVRHQRNITSFNVFFCRIFLVLHHIYCFFVFSLPHTLVRLWSPAKYGRNTPRFGFVSVNLFLGQAMASRNGFFFDRRANLGDPSSPSENGNAHLNSNNNNNNNNNV